MTFSRLAESFYSKQHLYSSPIHTHIHGMNKILSIRDSFQRKEMNQISRSARTRVSIKISLTRATLGPVNIMKIRAEFHKEQTSINKTVCDIPPGLVCINKTMCRKQWFFLMAVLALLSYVFCNKINIVIL